jgi:20S proteasome subunit beta 7
MLDKCPPGNLFIIMCFVTRSIEALGASAFITASFAIIANEFPDHVSSVFVSIIFTVGIIIIIIITIGNVVISVVIVIIRGKCYFIIIIFIIIVVVIIIIIIIIIINIIFVIILVIIIIIVIVITIIIIIVIFVIIFIIIVVVVIVIIIIIIIIIIIVIITVDIIINTMTVSSLFARHYLTLSVIPVCFLFQGALETFSGLGMMIGPPIGGALYAVRVFNIPQ